MSNFFKGIALFVLISCGVWVAVLWRWEATSRDMNTRDIVVYLALLPLTVFGLALLLRWAWRGAAQRYGDAAAAAAATAAAAPAAAAASSADDARRYATMQVLAAPLLCAAGASAAELQAAAKEGAPRPALDPELRDADGLPVLTARIPGLDTGALAAPLEAPLASTRAQRPEWADLTPPEHMLRALAALQEPLLQALAALAPWGARFEPAPDTPRGQTPEPAPERHVRVLLGWPADWSAFEQALGLAFATDLIETTSGAPIPAACFMLTAHAGSGEELLLHADRLLQTLVREGHDDPLIVAACHSTIGEAAIDALERDGLLFASQKRPKGRMPGEAAAALVLADATWPAAPDADGPVPHLHRPAVLRRDKSVDAPGRVSSELVLQAMTQALAASRLGADAVAALVCDADLHSARGAEWHGGALALAPNLDTNEDMRLLGSVTGAVGAVSALLVVACAAERARAGEKPCLAATLGDAFARLALVALPGPPPPVNASAASAAPAAGTAAGTSAGTAS